MVAMQWLKTSMEDERSALRLDSGKHNSLGGISGAISEEFPAMGRRGRGNFFDLDLTFDLDLGPWDPGTRALSSVESGLG